MMLHKKLDWRHNKRGGGFSKKFDGEYPKRFLLELLEYLSINKKEFPEANKMFEEPNINESYLMNYADSCLSIFVLSR